MHVGSAPRDLAETGSLEGSLHLRDLGQELAAADIRAGKADIVEAVVGEVPADVTGRTGSLAVEELEALLGVFADRFLVAGDPDIERSGARDDRPFIGRDRLADELRRLRLSRK